MSKTERNNMNRLKMWQACEETGSVNTVKAVLATGFPINFDLDGSDLPGDYTALHAAARSGHGEIVTVLINKGASIEARANLGRTALHLAALSDRGDCAKLLLEAKCSILDKDAKGHTALDICRLI